VIEYFIQNPLPQGSFINVNFPLNCMKDIKGLRMARQGRSYMVENPERRFHPEGSPYYWLGGQWSSLKEEKDSDVALLEQGYATVVPLFIGDLTDTRLLKKHQTAFSKETSKIG
jgi:5'-nucleotidase